MWIYLTLSIHCFQCRWIIMNYWVKIFYITIQIKFLNLQLFYLQTKFKVFPWDPRTHSIILFLYRYFCWHTHIQNNSLPYITEVEPNRLSVVNISCKVCLFLEKAENKTLQESLTKYQTSIKAKSQDKQMMLDPTHHVHSPWRQLLFSGCRIEQADSVHPRCFRVRQGSLQYVSNCEFTLKP